MNCHFFCERRKCIEIFLFILLVAKKMNWQTDDDRHSPCHFIIDVFLFTLPRSMLIMIIIIHVICSLLLLLLTVLGFIITASNSNTNSFESVAKQIFVYPLIEWFIYTPCRCFFIIVFHSECATRCMWDIWIIKQYSRWLCQFLFLLFFLVRFFRCQFSIWLIWYCEDNSVWVWMMFNVWLHFGFMFFLILCEIYAVKLCLIHL